MWELPEMRLLVALTVGALVGTEREKRWAKEDRAGTAGLRTFALTVLIFEFASQQCSRIIRELA